MSGSRPALTPPALAGAVLVFIALASLHTKIAGLAWLLWLVWAFQVWWQRAPGQPSTAPPPLVQAAQLWLGGLLMYAGIELGMAWGWHGPCCSYTSEVNSYLRLTLAALATLVLVRHLRPWVDMRHHINLALVTATVSGAVLAAVVEREVLPSHPIPWAGFMAFLVCLLLPQAWDTTLPASRRWLCGVGAGFGMLAVVLSQSRGVLVVFALPVLLALVHGFRGHRRLLVKAGLVAATLLTALTTLTLAPSDPLRLRLAVAETQQALESQDYNSSLGARVYLSQFAWHHISQSPWTGVGEQERLRLLQTAGLDQLVHKADALDHVRTLGHVHNQYLHHAMDHGLVGLLGFVAFLAFMVRVCFYLRQISFLSGLQMAFVTLIHIFTSLSNVNLAHNYYSLGLALTTGLIFIQLLPTTCTKQAR